MRRTTGTRGRVTLLSSVAALLLGASLATLLLAPNVWALLSLGVVAAIAVWETA